MSDKNLKCPKCGEIYTFDEAREYDGYFQCPVCLLDLEVIDARDPVTKPAHYTDGKIEVIDFIQDKRLNFCRGNVIKYVARAGKKDKSKEIEDLKKARQYLDFEIQNLERN